MGISGKVHTGFLLGKPKEKLSLRRPSRRWIMILKRIFKKRDWVSWTASIGHKRGTGGGLL